jgi:uncharacterized membrane protein YdbT with pleckstrin-like domain
MPLELNKKYTFGKRTFWFLFLRNGKIATLIIIALVWSAFAINIGSTNIATQTFLATHFDGIITISMLTQWILLLVGAVIIFLAIMMYEHHAQHKFMLDNHSFHIRRGILMVKEKVIPYRHIQNVDLEQPYHYRIFGVVRLNITTARVDTFVEENSKEKKHEKQNLIPLMDKKIAKELSHFLVSRGDMVN